MEKQKLKIKVLLILIIFFLMLIYFFENSLFLPTSNLCDISYKDLNKYVRIEGIPIYQNLYNENLFFKIKNSDNCKIQAIVFNFNRTLEKRKYNFTGEIDLYKKELEIIIKQIEQTEQIE